MQHKNITNLLKYSLMGLFMVFAGIGAAGRTATGSQTDGNNTGHALPPIDRHPPKTFETAYFGLG